MIILTWSFNKFNEKNTSSDDRVRGANEDLKSGVGCHLLGSFLIDSVSGNFHISFHPFANEYIRFRSQYPDSFAKINMSYEIDVLKFGTNEGVTKVSDVRKMINDLELEEQLFENYVDHKRNEYQKFIASFFLELFPYTLIDHRNDLTYNSLQHSFNRKIKVISIGTSPNESVSIRNANFGI